MPPVAIKSKIYKNLVILLFYPNFGNSPNNSGLNGLLILKKLPKKYKFDKKQ